MSQTTIETLTHDFVTELDAHVTERINARLRDVLAIGLVGVPGKERRPSLLVRVAQAPAAHRRKGPVQLCPVPKCGRTAAPVFNMVCGEHRNVAKSKIRRYREDRRRAKGRTS